jgi:hypothetical protein
MPDEEPALEFVVEVPLEFVVEVPLECVVPELFPLLAEGDDPTGPSLPTSPIQAPKAMTAHRPQAESHLSDLPCATPCSLY